MRIFDFFKNAHFYIPHEGLCLLRGYNIFYKLGILCILRSHRIWNWIK